eukprot:COSAG02_NODE_7839_length_2824_cov_1.624220_2_plen_297_part_00
MHCARSPSAIRPRSAQARDLSARAPAPQDNRGQPGPIARQDATKAVLTSSTMVPSVQSPEHSPCSSCGTCEAGSVRWTFNQLSSHGGLKFTQFGPRPLPRHCPVKSLPPPTPKSIRGIGFLAQVLPIGLVPRSTQTPGIESRVPLFQRSCCLVRSNSNGRLMKHSSVSVSLPGQSPARGGATKTVSGSGNVRLRGEGVARRTVLISAAVIKANSPRDLHVGASCPRLDRRPSLEHFASLVPLLCDAVRREDRLAAAFVGGQRPAGHPAGVGGRGVTRAAPWREVEGLRVGRVLGAS